MIELDALENLWPFYDALYCDLWGVVHNGRESFPDAVTALTRYRAQGGRVVLISNVPKQRDPIPGQLRRLGVGPEAWDAIVTSGDAIRAELAARAPGPMFKIGPDEDEILWEGLGLARSDLARAAFLGVSGLNDDAVETPESYADILADARARDLELLCANPDIVVRIGDRLVWCAGALARDYAALGGRVVMAGKPHPPIYKLAAHELRAVAGRDIPTARILAIGDGIGTDLVGAQAHGLDCLFIASGMHGEHFWSGGRFDRAKAEDMLAAEKTRATYVARALR